MSLRFPATLHSWQANFKTCSFTQPFTWGLGRRDELLASCRSHGSYRSAQSAASRKAGTQPSKLNRSPIPISRKPAAYEPLADKLAIRASPTLLYQASSYTNYLFGCYAVGGGLLTAAWLNFGTQFYVQPGEVPGWVPVFTSVGSFMLACIGFWMFLKPQNMVRAISCLPSSAKSGPGTRPLLLQIERTPILPFKQRKRVTVPPGDVTISSHTFNDDAEQKLEAAIAEIARREERLHAFAKTNLLTLPFRQAGYWMWRGFMGIRRAFTSEGFHYLHVRGNNRVWKMDKDPAWALDDGKALDKLVKIKLG